MNHRFLPGFLLILLTGCMEGQKTAPLPREASLYERLGGAKAIEKVVSDLVENVVKDDKIKENHKKHFREGDVASLKKKLVDQIGQATGGPQKYTGKNMKDAHKGLGVTDADFDALVDDLVKALDQNNVGKTEQTELLTILGGLREQVVNASP